MNRIASFTAVLALAGAWVGAADAPRASSGKEIFRFDTFGNETFWTDTLRMHEVIAKAVDPTTALSVGLKVDADALPPGILKTVDLKSPATTVALLKMNAVVGLKGTVVSKDGKDTLTRVGITCALCHSTVDDSVMPGIGKRLDGWPNRTLNPGAIIALSPALDAAKKEVYNSWGPGKYDPRFNQDGKNGPVVIPPAYGLAGVEARHLHRRRRHLVLEQLRGGHPDGRARARSRSRKLGIDVEAKGAGPGEAEAARAARVPAQPGQARRRRPAASTPRPPSAAQAVFAGAGRCASCHSGAALTDDKLHAPGGDRHGAHLRRAQRDQEVPDDAAARPVAAPALLPRRQGRHPGRRGGPLRRALEAEPDAPSRRRTWSST